MPSDGAVPDGSIATIDIADGATTTPKLADGSVTTPKLGTASVTQDKVARYKSLGQLWDAGIVGNTRVGRDLTYADFTLCGMGAPRCLFNFTGGSVIDVVAGLTITTLAGTLRTANGIMGDANGALKFDNVTLLSLGTGVRQNYGSWGCWFRCPNTTAVQSFFSQQDATNFG